MALAFGALLVAGFALLGGIEPAQPRLAPRVRKLRCLGSAAYDLCNVACGRLSAFYEMRLRPWDIAAGHVILREAGAVLDAVEREPQTWDTVASAPGIYEPFRDLARG